MAEFGNNVNRPPCKSTRHGMLAVRAMRIFPFILSFLSVIGCQYDPHGRLYTTSEPKIEDITGTYVLDRCNLPQDIGIDHLVVEVELHSDGTFTATNVPPWNMQEPDKNFTSSLLSGAGQWEKDTLGTLDPGSKRIWGVYLRTPDNRFHSADFTGSKPPYGLIFTLGDPDSGYAVILKKK